MDRTGRFGAEQRWNGWKCRAAASGTIMNETVTEIVVTQEWICKNLFELMSLIDFAEYE